MRYPPLRYYLERVLRDMGDISHWAAKVDISDIFYVFSGRGGVRESPRRQEGGGVGRFLLKIPGGGGLQEGEGPRGREGVCSELGNFGGGGLSIFWAVQCFARCNPFMFQENPNLLKQGG